MRFLGFDISRTKAAPSGLQNITNYRNGGWWPLITETSAGAWQTNATPLSLDAAVLNPTVYSCVTLIASDIAKMRYYLASLDKGIWTETTSAAFSPVLFTPNHYQTRQQFLEWWVTSLLLHGNTFVLKARDNRRIVTSLYVLDPCRVKTLQAPDGSVYYELCRDYLSDVIDENVTVPASEIIHDRLGPLFHPLVGISPLRAAWQAILQASKIQTNSTQFFGQGSNPGGVLTAPINIPQETADRLKAYWDSNFSGDNAGKVAVLGDGLHFERMAMTATDSQLIEQLKWSDERICSVFKVPAYKVGAGPYPAYGNVEAQDLNYHSQCLQKFIKSIELLLGSGLDLPTPYGVKFQLTDLIRMDTATKVQAARDAIAAGFMSPNEGRAMFDLPPVEGGDTPYMQNQNWPLSDLVGRDTSSLPQMPAPSALPPAQAPAAAEDAVDDPRKAIADLLFSARVSKGVSALAVQNATQAWVSNAA